MVKNPNLGLDEGIAEYERYLEKRSISDNTRKAFRGDIHIFARFLSGKPGEGTGHVKLADVTTEDIKSFLHYQEHLSGANSPKSVERRLTSLKVFFKWLHEAGYLSHDPSEGVAYKPFIDPLPEYLNDAEVEATLRAARQVAVDERLEHRPLTAITLVLETGIKKAECLALTVDDIERDDSGNASIFIRYQQQHLQYKDRILRISPTCLQVLESHIQRYETRGLLFDCTGRNLEYIFNRKVAPLAGLAALTFEMLRWTCAVGDYRRGEYTAEQLLVKYGLSPIGWSEMEAKLIRLTRPDSMSGTIDSDE